MDAGTLHRTAHAAWSAAALRATRADVTHPALGDTFERAAVHLGVGTYPRRLGPIAWQRSRAVSFATTVRGSALSWGSACSARVAAPRRRWRRVPRGESSR